MSDNQPKRMGRPPHQPTSEWREAVKHRAGLGLPQEAIARYLRIDPTTLRKHYADELERGIDEANTEVSGAIFNMATGRKVLDDGSVVRVDPNPTMAIWWSKTRMQWKEPPRDVIDAGDGNNTTIIVRGGLASVQHEPKTNGHDAHTTEE